MKATGIVGGLEDLGKNEIAKEKGGQWGIGEGDPWEIFTAGEGK